MVPHPGLEAHLHPFKVLRARTNDESGFYLHTSPEFYMKEMLTQGFEKIFTLTHCHRDEPKSSTHLPQFMMLEWYRSGERYEKIMSDTEELISFCYQQFNLELPTFERKTIDELFFDLLNFKISDYLETDKLKEKIKTIDSSLITSENLSWDDYFFLLFLNHIEPKLTAYPAIILYEYPAPLAALSTIVNDKWCERFEVYLNGVELGNCFNELTDFKELATRFKRENILKEKTYHYALPEPQRFFDVQRKLPQSAGIALGIDRLFMQIFNLEEIYNPGNFFKKA